MKDKFDKLKQYQYYVVIGIISVFALFFLPMLGSEVGVDLKLPNTVAGWIVYITTKLLVAIINMLIFHSFIKQGKINILDDPRYKEACLILSDIEPDPEFIPKSPKEWAKEAYSKKGTTIAITSVLSAVGLTQAVLTFDWVSLLTYFFVIVMGIVFGIFQMNNTEIYWTEEYLLYAYAVQKASKKPLEGSQNALESIQREDERSNTSIKETSLISEIQAL